MYKSSQHRISSLSEKANSYQMNIREPSRDEFLSFLTDSGHCSWYTRYISLSRRRFVKFIYTFSYWNCNCLLIEWLVWKSPTCTNNQKTKTRKIWEQCQWLHFTWFFLAPPSKRQHTHTHWFQMRKG